MDEVFACSLSRVILPHNMNGEFVIEDPGPDTGPGEAAAPGTIGVEMDDDEERRRASGRRPALALDVLVPPPPAALERREVLGDDLARLVGVIVGDEQLAPGARAPVAPHVAVARERGAPEVHPEAVVLEEPGEERARGRVGHLV